MTDEIENESYENEKNMNENENESVGIHMIGADGIARGWQKGYFHKILNDIPIPSIDNNDINYKNGCFNIELWKQLTNMIGNMKDSLGYSPIQMDPTRRENDYGIRKLSRYNRSVGLPIFHKELQNPTIPGAAKWY